MKSRKLLIVITLFLSSKGMEAQQVYQIGALDSLLMDRNPALKVAQIEMESHKAELKQDCLWQNPTVSVEQNVYNRLNGRYFDLSQQGETIVTLEQELPLNGEKRQRRRLVDRVAEADMAGYGRKVAEMKRAMHEGLIEMSFARESSQLYDEQIVWVESLMKQMEYQCGQGQVSAWQVERIRTLLLSMSLQRMDYQTLMIRSRERVRRLLDMPADWDWQPDWEEVHAPWMMELGPLHDGGTLLPDVVVAEKELAVARQECAIQQALARPNVAAFATYDKAGNFINDYYAIGLTIGLPVMNRNQEGRKSATLNVAKAEVEMAEVAAQSLSELEMIRSQWGATRELLLAHDATKCHDMDRMKEAMKENLQNQRIGITEFVDFYQGYLEWKEYRMTLEQRACMLREAWNYMCGVMDQDNE